VDKKILPQHEAEWFAPTRQDRVYLLRLDRYSPSTPSLANPLIVALHNRPLPQVDFPAVPGQ
jgi:hypothetical protein